MCRSLETVFAERGFAVTRVGSGKQALKLARRGGFDVLMLDERMDELSGVDVCIGLRDDPLFDHATPICIISQSHTTLPSRQAAYAAGAWEYCHQPVDFDALFMKIGTFLRARQELADAHSSALMDPSSGLYTTFGLQHLAEQLGAVVLELRAGRSQEDALRRMADRAGADEIRAFATLLIQSHKLGNVDEGMHDRGE